jgi:hypothetical protein
MRKFVLIMVTGLMAALLVAVGAPAQADDPYPGTIATKCKLKVVNDPVERTKRAVNKTQASTPNSNLSPKGEIKWKIKRLKGGFNEKGSIETNGRVETFNSSKLFKGGMYKSVVKFKPEPGSPFKKCKTVKRFSVQ